MIIEGGSRSNTAFFGEHLADTERANESAESVYSEGVGLGTPKEMLASFEARAAGSMVKNFFTHMAFNNKGDWPLNPAEEIKAYKMAAKKQGLEGQPFFIVRHVKPNGDQHFHTITLRIGADGKAVNNDYRDQFRMAESSREIEKALGLRRMENVIKRDPAAKQTQKWERYRGAATGYSVKRVARDLKDIRAKTGDMNGLAFVRALEHSRYVLARGDKLPFVIIDRTGTTHPLGARLSLKPDALAGFMRDVLPGSLPSIKEARAEQRRAQKEENKGVIREVWDRHRDPLKMIAGLNDKGFIVATGDKRGVFMCVDRNGYYVSLERAVGVGKQAFFNRMRDVDIQKLPTLDQAIATRKAERTAWKSEQPQPRSKGHGSITTQQFSGGTTRQIANGYLNLCRNPLLNLRGWLDATRHTGGGSHYLSAQPRTRLATNDGLRQVRAARGHFNAASAAITNYGVAGLIMADYAGRIAIAAAEGWYDSIPALIRERDGKIKAAQNQKAIDDRAEGRAARRRNSQNHL
ncbi:MAG: hypothetical protein WCD70_13450 [Alphaproteobacteria bacterium]